MKLIKHEEMTGTIVNHHVRCLENHEHQVQTLQEFDVDPNKQLFKCICSSLPTLAELNELLEV